jgi:hypothetical protein
MVGMSVLMSADMTDVQTVASSAGAMVAHSVQSTAGERVEYTAGKSASRLVDETAVVMVEKRVLRLDNLMAASSDQLVADM